MQTRSFVLPGEPVDEALDGPRTLVLAFGDPALTPDGEALSALRAAFGRSVVIGCSASGQLLDDALVDDGLVALAVRFDHTDLHLARTTIDGIDDSRAAGQRLAEQLPPDGLAGVLLLCDGLDVNGTDVVEGLTAGLSRPVPISGGLASDHARFEHTWVLAGDALGGGLVGAVGLYGDRVRITHGCRGGWEPFGPARRVTRSDGNRLFELDGRPALALYRSYLGVYADGLPGSALLFPLAIQTPDRPAPVVRTVLAVDEDTQSMTFAGDLPEGATAQLMRATHDMLVDGAVAAARDCGVADVGSAVAFAVSCVGRRLVFGERAEEEVEAVRAVLGAVPLVGFYSNCEVSPGTGFSELHNQTMTLALLAEV